MDQLKVDNLKRVFQSIVWDDPSSSYIVPKTDLLNLCKFLRDTEDFCFKYLKCLTAVDYTDRIEVVYEIDSFRLGVGIRIKAVLPAGDLDIDSVTAVWGAADWYEREAYDMFGIVFAGHPNLKRILLEDNWKGFPLRKNYQDDKIIKKPVA